MSGYARVTFTDALSGKRQTVTLEILGDGPAWLHGRPVNREGIETGDTVDAHGTVTRQEYLIEKACITRRTDLELDVHYGILVPPAELSEQHKAFMGGA